MCANAQRDGRPAEHRWRPLFNAAKFGWRSLLDCRAVTLPRRETVEICWGAPNSPTVLSGYWAEVHHIIRTCVGGIGVWQAFSDCRYMPELRRYGLTKLGDGAEMAILLRPVSSASHMQHISDMHSKFALRPHHVPKYGKHPISDRWD